MGERWGRVPAGVPSAQAGVYRALSMNAGRGGVTTRKVATIAKDAGRSIRRTQAALRRLEELGWIMVRRHPGRKSTYHLPGSQAPRQGTFDFSPEPLPFKRPSPPARGDVASGVMPPGRVTESSGGDDGIVRGGVTESSGVTLGEGAASLGSRATSGYTVSGERSSGKEVSKRGRQEQTASPAQDRDLEALPTGTSDLIHQTGVSIAVVMRERRRRPDQPEWILAALLAVLAAQEVRTVRKPDAYFTRITASPEPPNDKLMAHAKQMMKQARAERGRGNATLLFGRPFDGAQDRGAG